MKTIGITLTYQIFSGVVKDHSLDGGVRVYPEDSAQTDALVELPMERLVEVISDQVIALCGDQAASVGLALPGIVRGGIVQDSPNLPQLKGVHITEQVTAELKRRNCTPVVNAMNDADAIAAGIAATRGQLDRLVRVWTIGFGIGFGRYPWTEGVWEGGHYCVSLDPKETYCGCGGRGHLEGIMGHRAMRLRFLDLEPEEVFAEAKKGDARCVEFVKLWHRALAAGVANSIHMEGPGRFYFTGFNVVFLDLNLLKDALHQMVTMSPLQSYTLEVIPSSDEVAVIGAGVVGLQAMESSKVTG